MEEQISNFIFVYSECATLNKYIDYYDYYYYYYNRESEIGDEDTSVNNFIQKNMSQLALANAVIEHNKIKLVREMGAFLVEGSKGDKNAVALFKKEKCQCPASLLVLHVLAAKKQLAWKLMSTDLTKDQYVTSK